MALETQLDRQGQCRIWCAAPTPVVFEWSHLVRRLLLARLPPGPQGDLWPCCDRAPKCPSPPFAFKERTRTPESKVKWIPVLPRRRVSLLFARGEAGKYLE